MTACKHKHLVLVPASAPRLRCRRCHLTLKADELVAGCCPECYERSGRRSKDFETLLPDEKIRYRCEACGAIIVYTDASPGTIRQPSTL